MNLINKKSKEHKEQQIALLKKKIADSDYKAIKFAEGWMTEEEYGPIREERQSIRNLINQLENT